MTEYTDNDRSALLDKGLVSIPEAAAILGLDVKRLRGYVHRNGIPDPIGDLATDQVYGWSLRETARRAALRGNEVQP